GERRFARAAHYGKRPCQRLKRRRTTEKPEFRPHLRRNTKGGAGMFTIRQISFLSLSLTVAALTLPASVQAQSAQGAQSAQSKPAAQAPAPSAQPPAATAAAPKDPREGDPVYEQAQRLMKAIDSVLQDTARQRGEA